MVPLGNCRAVRWLKHHPTTVFLYDTFLSLRCRDMEAYVFVATTGRTGTDSLRRIFQETVDGAACFHEPHPIMFSDYPRNEGIDRDEYFRHLFFTLKRIYIKRASVGHRYYVETNHQFIKNFACVAIPYFGSRIRIIHLKRDPVSVARSFYSIESVPGKTARGHYYMLDPDDPTNIIRIPELSHERGELGHDMYKCLWYWYEIEARVKAVKERYPNANWVTMTTDQLNDKVALKAMFDSLEIPVNQARLDRLESIRENMRLDEKGEILDWERCNQMHEKLRAKIHEIYGKDFVSDLAGYVVEGI